MRRFAGLRRRADFSRLRRRGRRTATPSLTLYREAPAPGDERALVGIVVSKAVGKAVVRNRLRRRLAAIVHETLANGARMRLLIVTRPVAAALPYAILQQEVELALGGRLPEPAGGGTR
ncbi:MAG: ribonuclease P protein component [Vulcanimicrobiaceae bacterium]